jgi:hypothetical protein
VRRLILFSIIGLLVGAVVPEALAQDLERFDVRGTVIDAATETPLPGASVDVVGRDEGGATDAEGRYAIRLPEGRYTIEVAFVGYTSTRRTINLSGDTTLDVALERRTIDLDEIRVTGQADRLESLEIGVERLPVRELEELPTFLGSVDIVRSLLQLPGVSSVGDGAAGFNVRGGNVDQNLILFEDTPVYYPSHLFGFFSPFNADVVSDVTLYKAGVPPSYGGRASAVLDVQQKTGDATSFHGRGGIGPITSRLMIEGPIVKNRTSFLAASRVSYVNWILDLTDNEDLNNSDAFFNDVNVGLTHRFGPRTEVQVTGYRSFDDFALLDTTYAYTTNNLAVEWRRLVDERWTANVKAVAADYGFTVTDDEPGSAFELDAQVRSFGLSADVTWKAGERHTVDAGLSTQYFEIDPARIRPDGPISSITAFRQPPEYALESAAYLGDDLSLTERLKVRGGLRVSLFNQFGPASTLVFADGQPRSRSSVIDTVAAGRGEVTQTYAGIEPRIAARYRLDAKRSLKVSYTRLRQYLHQLSNTEAVTPLDVWHVSDRYRSPQIGDQVSLGYYRDFRDGRVTASVETYYKWLQDIIDFKGGTDLLVNDALAADLLSGRGRSYGVELYLHKPAGQHSGSLSYTFSRAERRVAGAFEEERINDGDWYPANFDRPHDLSLAYRYTGDDPRVSWNFNFVYRTGRPVTFPVSKFVVDGIPVADFSNRNQVRIPDYHRLDLSLRLDLERRENRGWNASWTFSVFNVYGRRNAYSVFFGRKDGGTVPQAYKLSVFGTVFPSLTYTFEF